MDTMDLDQLQAKYKQAVDEWVDAIETEEGLATADHSMVQMERWDMAGLKLHDAELTAKKARDEYKNALRLKNYGFQGARATREVGRVFRCPTWRLGRLTWRGRVASGSAA